MSVRTAKAFSWSASKKPAFLRIFLAVDAEMLSPIVGVSARRRKHSAYLLQAKHL